VDALVTEDIPIDVAFGDVYRVLDPSGAGTLPGNGALECRFAFVFAFAKGSLINSVTRYMTFFRLFTPLHHHSRRNAQKSKL